MPTPQCPQISHMTAFEQRYMVAQVCDCIGRSLTIRVKPATFNTIPNGSHDFDFQSVPTMMSRSDLKERYGGNIANRSLE